MRPAFASSCRLSVSPPIPTVVGDTLQACGADRNRLGRPKFLVAARRFPFGPSGLAGGLFQATGENLKPSPPSRSGYFLASATFLALPLYSRIAGRTSTSPFLPPGTAPFTSSRFLS